MISRERERAFVDEEINRKGFSSLSFYGFDSDGKLLISFTDMPRNITAETVRENILKVAYSLDEDELPPNMDEATAHEKIISLKDLAERVPGLKA